MLLERLLPTPKLRTVVVCAVGIGLLAALVGVGTDRTPLGVLTACLDDLGIEAAWPSAVTDWLAQRRALAGRLATWSLFLGLAFAVGEGVDGGELDRSRAALTAVTATTVLLQLDTGVLVIALWAAAAALVGAFIGQASDNGSTRELLCSALMKVMLIALMPLVLPAALMLSPWPRGEVA